MGSGAKIRCNSCNINQESTKQLSFKKLPLVLCFHLKRFEQTSKVRKKISDFISFPYELDLLPFMSCYNSSNSQSAATAEAAFKHASSSAASQNAKSADSIFRQSMDFAPGDSGSPAFLGKDAGKYVLYAVVNHHGTIDSGHYTSFVRLKGAQSNSSTAAKSADLNGTQTEKWIHCDDAVLTLSSRETCLRSEAYLLFYHKKHLVFE